MVKDSSSTRVGRLRLDTLLVQRGLAESRAKAQALILAGDVWVNGQVQRRPGTLVEAEAVVEVRGGLPYVSRGGLKLAAALDRFGLSPAGLICLDVGASTGGFTDCLLQRGARRVYAIDVGYGQLDWRLRRDPRVVVLERTNIRYLESLPEAIDLATIDVSFISLRLVLPAVGRLVHTQGQAIALVKPQFEAGRGLIGKGGVVRDPALHRLVLRTVAEQASSLGWIPRGLFPSSSGWPARASQWT